MALNEAGSTPKALQGVTRTVRIVKGVIDSVDRTDRSRLYINGREVTLPPGALILPGFVDTHCHLIGLGLMASRVALRGAGSAHDCARRAAERARVPRGAEWVVGFGWNQEEWEQRDMPTAAMLDALVPDMPVVLYRIDSHAAWCNTAALRRAGITQDAVANGRVVAGPGGSIEVDAEGRPTGVLIDNAMGLVDAAIPPPSVEQQAAWIAASVDACLRLGITEVHDMNVEPERLEAMARAAERGGMRLRCNVFLKGAEDAWRVAGRPARIGPNVDLVGVKYFADGALGSRGALLLEPYEDAPDTRGLALLESEELAARAAVPLERGFAIATHAIGDAANRLALDAYERLRSAYPGALLRVEHAQTVHPDDLPRFARLGVIPAMQAVHCTSDAQMAERRLGRARCARAYPWASMVRAGLPVLGGSDFPIESADPLAGLRAFVYREPVPGAGPWFGAECITAEQALAAYTAWAPLGIPGAPNRGRLAAGCDADIVVLSADPFVDADAHVLMTIVAGERVG